MAFVVVIISFLIGAFVYTLTKTVHKNLRKESAYQTINCLWGIAHFPTLLLFICLSLPEEIIRTFSLSLPLSVTFHINTLFSVRPSDHYHMLVREFFIFTRPTPSH